jgi:hypothetical protein
LVLTFSESNGVPTPSAHPRRRLLNKRGTCEQWIKEGKGAIEWTRLSCCSAANAVRLQLHALAYNLTNFMRTLALQEAIKQWSLTSLREKRVKIGAKIVRHGRYVIFQMAEVAVPKELFHEVLRLIAELRQSPPARQMVMCSRATEGRMRTHQLREGHSDGAHQAALAKSASSAVFRGV